MSVEFLRKLDFLFKPATLKVAYGGRGVSGIYAIRNILNGKIYIGSAKNFNARWAQHLYELRNNKHPNKHLQFAYNKYWEFNFQFLIIEFCDFNKLEEREQHWIDVTNCCCDKIGYNIALKARSNIGIKFAPRSIEHKKRISETHKGKIVSKETRLKMSLAQKGKTHRDKDKWPCEAGIKCKCKECKERKRLYMNNWRKSKIGIYVQ